MTEPAPIVFGVEGTDLDGEGIPLVESVINVFVGRCQACGRRAEAQRKGSVLANIVVVDGTAYGDTFCTPCVPEIVEGPVIELEPQSDRSQEGGEDDRIDPHA